MYVNNIGTPFPERRCRQWTSSNWRTKANWNKLEKQKEINAINAQFIRERNNSKVYGDKRVQQYEQFMINIDKEEKGEEKVQEKVESEENFKVLDQISLKNPSEMEPAPKTKRSEKRMNKNELFTTEEMK